MSDDNTPQVGDAVVLALRGQRASTARLPAVFTAHVNRDVGGATAATQTTCLPAGLLVPKTSIDLRTAVPRRGAPAGPLPTALADYR